MGIETVLVVTDADLGLAYVKTADVVVTIGGARNYLNADLIIQAAVDNRCSALHPGWGFLAENPTFAAKCEAARVSFVGPTSASMRQMADKAEARKTMKALGVPPIPGTDEVVLSSSIGQKLAMELGYPVLLKAISGGGGKGMRAVHNAESMDSAFAAATAEALNAFGDGRLYMEKLIVGGRHIELQILSDGENVEVLGLRDCSVQRRHQKLIEESPSLAVSPKVSDTMSTRIKQACVSLGYRGAGTIEMLQDVDGSLYFMEMNTRLQVEHTVTEEVTGVDLVEWQLKIAANHTLNMSVDTNGHAIECRINAESPIDGFRPCPGVIDKLVLPSGVGVRVDTHLSQGDVISPFYDSMVAKIICKGSNRKQAIERMVSALTELHIGGVSTTKQLHLAILQHDIFSSGNYDTLFLENELDGLLGLNDLEAGQ